MGKEVICGCKTAVAAMVFLSMPVADYQRDEDAIEWGRGMPPARKAFVVRIHKGAKGNSL